MTGRRHKDFRSGDLSEELGILLTKGIAAVATVARPEDVGVDAIATLLRDAENDLLIAENSFYIQYKSDSIRKIQFTGHEVRWLEKLKLPFLIGSVNRDNSVIDLYPTHRLSLAMLERQHDSVELLLDRQPHGKPIQGFRDVYIGPPILSWSVAEMTNPDFATNAYSVLKPYLDAEQRNIDYRSIRYLELIHWETGKPPRCEQGNVVIGGPEDEILRVIRSMAPHFYVLAAHALSNKNAYAMETVFRLGEYMRECGYDPDPKSGFRVLWEHGGEAGIEGVSDATPGGSAPNDPPD